MVHDRSGADHAFGKLTQDEYFIHMDPVRAAKETPFGGSIAHGFLTLSMMTRWPTTRCRKSRAARWA